MTSEPDRHEVIIIGAGAAGLSAAQVLGRQQRRTLVVDGGAPRNSRADGIHMYLSRDGFAPLELLSTGHRELHAYPSVTVRQALATSIAGSIDDFTVTLNDGTRHSARRLILATGQVDQPWDVPGVPERFGTSVLHCPFCHGWEARGKSIAVLGREPAEVMLAAYLADRYSDDIAVATHGPHRLPPPILDNLGALGITVIEEQVVELHRRARRPHSAVRRRHQLGPAGRLPPRTGPPADLPRPATRRGSPAGRLRPR